MFQTLRNEYEIKIGKREPQKSPIQLNEGKHLMNDDEIIQKIKESQTKVITVKSRRKKPWINYEFIHPGQWVNIFILDNIID
jgi:hypothetical protein